MKIQELAEKSGLTVYTIRFYEKEGLLDSRHVQREENNYRNYSDEALERLKLVKKFQGVGCSLAELKEILWDHDTNTRTNQQVLEWIRQKISEIECKKNELDQMIVTLNWMLEYRMTLKNDPEKLTPSIKLRSSDNVQKYATLGPKVEEHN
ncbi:mercuric resistance operon regulatory protein [Desulfosporosinus acididurans]|uniref:Mercuric resistance operon regulatory protein n=1 Tax=Desulfosporosinus acididurans TaxID=476652 RepID=A0A0J1IIB6_9FIRM|nr:mercuric resistance operon regulatory protein [Desulfosporosinus acididurans]